MKRACVIGWPISHSLSPVIHDYWLKHHDLDGEYVTAAVAPEAFDAFLTNLSGRGFCGANITIPHKIEAYRLCERRDSAAQAIGAVNTVWLDHGALCGANTDAYGFAANLDREALGWDRGGPAVVIGAGGAARAIVFTLVQRGFEDIRIVNRSTMRAQELAASFPPSRPFGFEAVGRMIEGAQLVVNCSTLGMAGSPPLDIDLAGAAANAAVCDIVYHPLETGLLRQARKRKLTAVDGLGMLLHQAVPAFERWFGVRPEVTSGLRRAVLDAIVRREDTKA
jgi:shikimate dehydrogenase